MPSPYSFQLITGYAELQTALGTKLAAAGWSEVYSGIFKSAVDADGNAVYVKLFASAPNMGASTALSLNSAGTDVIGQITKTCIVQTSGYVWHFYIYDKWFYCYAEGLTSPNTDFLGCGLYKPYPHSPFAPQPIFSMAGTNGIWISASYTSYLSSMSTLFPNGDTYIASVSLGMGGGVNSYPATQGAQTMGLFIQPMTIYAPAVANAILGTLYNTILLSGMYWETTKVMFPPFSRVAYGNDRVYITPTRPTMHLLYGLSPAFQILGSGV